MQIKYFQKYKATLNFKYINLRLFLQAIMQFHQQHLQR